VGVQPESLCSRIRLDVVTTNTFYCLTPGLLGVLVISPSVLVGRCEHDVFGQFFLGGANVDLVVRRDFFAFYGRWW